MKLETGFTRSRNNNATLEALHADGHSLAAVIGTRIVVLDVDVSTPERPDKQGDESLTRLSADLGVDFSPFLTVVSPTGGQHYYFRRSEDLKFQGLPREYPDIDLLTGSRYVLIPPSPHWSGTGNYEFAPGFKGVIDHA